MDTSQEQAALKDKLAQLHTEVRSWKDHPMSAPSALSHRQLGLPVRNPNPRGLTKCLSLEWSFTWSVTFRTFTGAGAVPPTCVCGAVFVTLWLVDRSMLAHAVWSTRDTGKDKERVASFFGTSNIVVLGPIGGT